MPDPTKDVGTTHVMWAWGCQCPARQDGTQGQSVMWGVAERFPTAHLDCSTSQVLHFANTRICELRLKQKCSTRSTSQHSRCTDASLYILLCCKLVCKWTSNACSRQRAFTGLFGDWVQISFAQWLELQRGAADLLLVCHCINAWQWRDLVSAFVYLFAQMQGTEEPLHKHCWN